MLPNCTGTGTNCGNEPRFCPKCNVEIWNCICSLKGESIEEKPDRVPIIKASYSHKSPITFLRRTPHSISGMKGLKLLKRINKK